MRHKNLERQEIKTHPTTRLGSDNLSTTSPLSRQSGERQRRLEDCWHLKARTTSLTPRHIIEMLLVPCWPRSHGVLSRGVKARRTLASFERPACSPSGGIIGRNDAHRQILSRKLDNERLEEQNLSNPANKTVTLCTQSPCRAGKVVQPTLPESVADYTSTLERISSIRAAACHRPLLRISVLYTPSNC